MRNSCFWFVFPVLIFMATSSAGAQDGFFSDARTLRSGQFALGVQPIIYTQNDDLMLNVRGAYGLQAGLTLHGKLGVFRDETYVGTHIEYSVAGEPQSDFSFALVGGIYGFGDVGLKLSAVASKQLDPFSLYSGITFEPLFADNTLSPVLLPIGVDIPLVNRTMNFVFEGDIALNDDGKSYQAITFGINFYL